MPIKVSAHLCRWLQTNGLEGYLQIADTEPPTQATEIIKDIDADKITYK